MVNSLSTPEVLQLPFQLSLLNALSAIEAIVVEPATTEKEPVPLEVLDFTLIVMAVIF